ncbi:hypothetical protein [Moraxella atlantae]|uniref:Uncharacterized protein n=1 Tax=Faucicola atlantae TaxID=34059 RepID=A0A378Q4T9_9GAMM|nr:hypothetical protein [Moraxella atlantae]STY95546.1 Uncharacterised protein [Moraxella atlantae]
MNTFGMMSGVLVVGDVLPVKQAPMATHYDTSAQPITERARTMPAIRIAVKTNR